MRSKCSFGAHCIRLYCTQIPKACASCIVRAAHEHYFNVGLLHPTTMRLTIVNQTGSTILYYPLPSESLSADLQIALSPASSTTTDLQKHCSKLALQPREQLKHDEHNVPATAESRMKRDGADPFHVHVKVLGKARSWELVQPEEDACPWNLYRVRVRFLTIVRLREVS